MRDERSPALAGHTYAFRDRPLEAALDELDQLGLDRVELWLGHVPESPDRAARALEQRGLTAAAVSAGMLGADARPFLDACRLADAVGAGVVVTCALPDMLPGLVARLPDGLTLCVENHWYHAVARPPEHLAAIGAGDRVAACLDTGHGLLAGVPAEGYVAELGSRLAHVHLKDDRRPSRATLLLGRKLRRKLLARPQPVFPGSGDLDLPATRRALEDAGFRGTVSVEYEGADPGSGLAELLARWRAVDPQA